MIIEINHGFVHSGMLFGWHKKQLYRLPQMFNKRSYTFKKVNIFHCKKRNKKFYQCYKSDLTLEQVKQKTVVIPKVVINIVESEDCPF
jgi:glutaredoxin-related protein